MTGDILCITYNGSYCLQLIKQPQYLIIQIAVTWLKIHILIYTYMDLVMLVEGHWFSVFFGRWLISVHGVLNLGTLLLWKQ